MSGDDDGFELLRRAVGGAFDGVDASQFVAEMRGKPAAKLNLAALDAYADPNLARLSSTAIALARATQNVLFLVARIRELESKRQRALIKTQRERIIHLERELAEAQLNLHAYAYVEGQGDADA